MIGSSSVYRKGASPNRVPDAATPKRKLDSKNLLYVRVSGAKRDSLPLKRIKQERSSCNTINERNYDGISAYEPSGANLQNYSYSFAAYAASWAHRGAFGEYFPSHHADQ